MWSTLLSWLRSIWAANSAGVMGSRELPTSYWRILPCTPLEGVPLKLWKCIPAANAVGDTNDRSELFDPADDTCIMSFKTPTVAGSFNEYALFVVPGRIVVA